MLVQVSSSYLAPGLRFENVRKKENLNEMILNFAFNILGFHYDSPIRLKNFCHLASQAWIISYLTQLRRRGHMTMTYKEMLNFLKWIHIDEAMYISNLEVLIKQMTSSDMMASSLKIMSHMYYHKLVQSQRETLEHGIEAEIQQKTFEEILLLIMKKAVNYTLNELDPNESNKGSLLLLNVFTKLAKDKYKRITLEVFSSEIKKIWKSTRNRNRIDPILEYSIEEFYNFSRTSFNELVEDLYTTIFKSVGLANKLYIILKLDYNPFLDMILSTWYEMNIWANKNFQLDKLSSRSVMQIILPKTFAMIQPLRKRIRTLIRNWRREIKLFLSPPLMKIIQREVFIAVYSANELKNDLFRKYQQFLSSDNENLHPFYQEIEMQDLSISRNII